MKIKIKKYEFEGSFELHNQIFNKVMFKYNSLSEGVLWGYIDNNDIHFVSHPIESVNFIQTVFEKKDSSYILYQPKNTQPKKILISLHGGPESFEFNENRYNGLYRELIFNGFIVCALNYNGSIYRNPSTQKIPWKNWKIVIEEILNVCSKLSKQYSIDYTDISLLGVSFGATLSLLCASYSQNHFKSIVSVAPLMNLEKHLEKASNAELKWFLNRFSNEEIRNMFNWRNFYQTIDIPIFLIQGNKDSILDFKETYTAFSTAIENKKNGNL